MFLDFQPFIIIKTPVLWRNLQQTFLSMQWLYPWVGGWGQLSYKLIGNSPSLPGLPPSPSQQEGLCGLWISSILLSQVSPSSSARLQDSLWWTYHFIVIISAPHFADVLQNFQHVDGLLHSLENRWNLFLKFSHFIRPKEGKDRESDICHSALLQGLSIPFLRICCYSNVI